MAQKNWKTYLSEALENTPELVIVQWTFGKNATPADDPDFNIGQCIVGTREQVDKFLSGKISDLGNGAVVKEFAVSSDGSVGRGTKRLVKTNDDGSVQWLPMPKLTGENDPVVLGNEHGAEGNIPEPTEEGPVEEAANPSDTPEVGDTVAIEGSPRGWIVDDVLGNDKYLVSNSDGDQKEVHINSIHAVHKD